MAASSTPPVIHAFNTGRLYTIAGQRIAWTILSTSTATPCIHVVAMVDRDRMLDYVLTVYGAPTDQDVLYAYDWARERQLPYVGHEADYAAARAVHRALSEAAAAAPSLTDAGVSP